MTDRLREELDRAWSKAATPKEVWIIDGQERGWDDDVRRILAERLKDSQ